MKGKDVLDQLFRLIGQHGSPEYIRSDNGSEFIEQTLQKWLLLPAYKRFISILAVRGRTGLLKASIAD